MDAFSFLVAHRCSAEKVDKFKVFGRLKEWVERRPAIVDRCGGKNGKLVKFNEKKFLSDLESDGGKDISFYSERIWDKGEVDEFLNCDFSVGYSDGEEFLMSSRSSKLDLRQLVESFWDLGEVVDLFDYAYAYSETQAFGFGYGIGVSMLDDDHPLLWEGHARVGAWKKMQWAGKSDEFIRDVFPFNIYSSRKIEALPETKRKALVQAMENIGECSAKKGYSVWVLKGDELDKARGYLKDYNLIASCLK